MQPIRKDHAISAAGSASELARVLHLRPQAVSQWGDTLPELQAYRLRELRPAIYRRVRRLESNERTTAT